MEKISGIIPPSRRPVLESGEVPKPRRAAEAVVGEEGPAVPKFDWRKAVEIKMEMEPVQTDFGPLKGKQLNVVA